MPEKLANVLYYTDTMLRLFRPIGNTLKKKPSRSASIPNNKRTIIMLITKYSCNRYSTRHLNRKNFWRNLLRKETRNSLITKTHFKARLNHKPTRNYILRTMKLHGSHNDIVDN